MGWIIQGLQGPPTPLPPSWFPRVGRGGEQSWPAVTNKKQDASFPSTTSSKVVGHETEGLASVCRAGSETLLRGLSWKNTAQERQTFGKGFPELLIPPPLPPLSARLPLGDNPVEEQKGRERRRGHTLLIPDQTPTPQWKPGRWGEPWSTSRKEPELSGAWTREDGTHIDSVASGGIWGPQGAGAPHEIHAAFKVSVWG